MTVCLWCSSQIEELLGYGLVWSHCATLLPEWVKYLQSRMRALEGQLSGTKQKMS